MKSRTGQIRDTSSATIFTQARFRKYFAALLGCCAAVLTLALTGIGATVISTWKAAVSGNWAVDANWTNVPPLGGFPNDGNGGVATYDAVINATGAAYTVTLNTTNTVEHLTLNSANALLTISGGTLTANTGMDLTTGSLLLNGGTISATAINAAAGTLTLAANTSNLLTGVTVNGDLNLNTSSAVVKIGGGTTFTQAHLAASGVSLGFLPGQTLSGTILFEGATSGNRVLEMDGNPGAFTIGTTGVIRTNTGLAGNGIIGGSNYFGGPMTLTNNGLISSQVSGRTITISAASLSNSGTGTLGASNGGILTINSTNWSNAGNLGASTGSTANLNGAWSNLGGTITVDATSVLNLGGSFSTANLGTLSLATGSTVSITGAWDNSGHTFTFDASTGSWTLNGGTISGGTLGFASGQNLLIVANSSNMLTGVTVNGDLNLTVGSAVTKIGGGTTFTQAHLAANGVSLGFLADQTLSGTILFEGAGAGSRVLEMDVNGGAFTVNTGGVIRTNTGFAGSGFIGGSAYFGGPMTLTNNGLISSQVSGRPITISAVSLTNSGTGTMEATNGGILTINSTNWSNAGTLRALTGSTANLNGAWSNLGGTITVDATSVLNLGGSFATANLGTLSLAAGSNVSVTGAWGNSGHTFTFDASTGSWTLNGGTISGGALGFAGGQNLLIAANSNNLLTGVTINGDLNLIAGSAVTKIGGGTTFAQAHLAANGVSLGFLPGQTLSGTILFEGAGAGSRVLEMDGNPGAFTVNNGGVIRTNTGFGGSGFIGGSAYFGGPMTLTNNGLISSQVSGRTITISALSLTNGVMGTLDTQNGGILTIAPTNTWTNSGMISVNAATVNLGGTFDVTGGIGTWSNTGGTVNIVGKVLNTGHVLTLDSSTGSWTLNGGTFSGGTLAFAASQNLIVAANSNNLLTGVTVNGDLNLNTAAAITKIDGGATFTQAHLAANGVSLSFLPDQTLTGTILMEGAIAGVRYVEMNGSPGAFTIGTTGVIRTNAGLTGDGIIGGSNYFGGAMTLTNNGFISSQVSGRTMTISAASLTNSVTGTLDAQNGGVLTIAPTNTWTNSGMITVNAATINLGGTFDTTGGIGTWSNTGGMVNITGTVLNTGHLLTLDGSTGSWTLNGGTFNGGTLAFAASQNLILAANGSNLLTGVTVNGDLNLNTAAAVTRIAGGTTFTQAHLAANGATLSFLPGQTLTGTILFEGAGTGNRVLEMNGSPGAFTIGTTGIIRTNVGFAGDAVIGGSNYFGGAMTLSNNGLISSQVSGRTITISAAAFANNLTGTMEAKNGGILTLGSSTSTWTNSGTISVSAATVNLGGTFDTTGGIGTWSNTGGTVNITGTVFNTGHLLTLDSNTGSWTLSGGTFSGGTLAFAPGQTLILGANVGNLLTGVTVNGDLNLSTGGADTTIAGGATFTQAHLAANSTSLSYLPGQTLSGTILFEGAIGGSRIVEMNGSAGAFTIGATGVIRTNAGLTGDGTIGGSNYFGGAMALSNNGLISSQVSGRSITISATSFTNSGTLEATNGGLITVSNGYTQTAGTTRVANNSTITVTSPNTMNIVTGSLEGSGTIASKVTDAGTILPGGSGAGALNITNDLTLAPTSAIQIEIGGITQGSQYDLLSEAGTVALTLQGTLSVTTIDGFVPDFADTFTVLTSNQPLAGAFSNVANGARYQTGNGLDSFQVNYGPGSGYGANQVVLSNFLIPEPTSTTLLASGGLGLVGLRKRRRSRGHEKTCHFS